LGAHPARQLRQLDPGSPRNSRSQSPLHPARRPPFIPDDTCDPGSLHAHQLTSSANEFLQHLAARSNFHGLTRSIPWSATADPRFDDRSHRNGPVRMSAWRSSLCEVATFFRAKRASRAVP
jgi:hypothetical protein